MAIASTDLKYRLSGGTSNSDSNASLGGAVSFSDISSSLFDDVSGTQATAGDVNYRCFYVKNNHSTLTALSTKIWIQANTPLVELAIGLGAAAVNATESAIANEATAPSSVTFSTPANEAAALVIGDLVPGAVKAVWVRRTISAGASAVSSTASLRVKCDTLP